MGRIVIGVVAGGAAVMMPLCSMNCDATAGVEDGRYEEEQDAEDWKDGNQLYRDLPEDQRLGHGGQYRGLWRVWISWGVWIVTYPA